MSTVVNVVLGGAGAAAKLPPLRILTVSANFVIPLWRDVLLALGFVDASRPSVDACMRARLSVVVVVGGALEALDARPGVAELTLNRRKGFVRVALEHGARLVPVYCFGENELYDQAPNPEGSRLRAAQVAAIRAVGFTLPAFKGRGVFSHDTGFLPRRVPLTTVTGPPLVLPKIASPTDGDVDEWHARYVSALKQLHDTYAPRFPVVKPDGSTAPRPPLRIVA